MEYPIPSSTYLQPITPSAWVTPGFLGTPLPYDHTHVPGCTMSTLPMTAFSPGPSSVSVPAPLPTMSSHQGSQQIAASSRHQTPTENSLRRTLRRKRQSLFEQLELWSGYMMSNYTRIPVQDTAALIKPFGQIPPESISRYWSLPQADPVAYVLHCNLEGAYSTSYALYIPSLAFSLIPYAIASLIDPSLEQAERDEVSSPEFGITPTLGDLTLTTRLGSYTGQMVYHASGETQALILGGSATSTFGLAFCPLKLQLVTAIGERLSTIRIPFRWPETP